jgi:hypothetical protein
MAAYANRQYSRTSSRCRTNYRSDLEAALALKYPAPGARNPAGMDGRPLSPSSLVTLSGCTWERFYCIIAFGILAYQNQILRSIVWPPQTYQDLCAFELLKPQGTRQG